MHSLPRPAPEPTQDIVVAIGGGGVPAIAHGLHVRVTCQEAKGVLEGDDVHIWEEGEEFVAAQVW